MVDVLPCSANAFVCTTDCASVHTEILERSESPLVLQRRGRFSGESLKLQSLLIIIGNTLAYRGGSGQEASPGRCARPTDASCIVSPEMLGNCVFFARGSQLLSFFVRG